MSDYEAGRLYKATVHVREAVIGERLLHRRPGHHSHPWRDTTTGGVYTDDALTDVHGPLVLLDLDKSEGGSLLPGWLRQQAREIRHLGSTGPLVHDLRLLANQIEEQTKPPKPPEPKGLGAVVKDREGKRYSRHTVGPLAPWIAEDPADKDRPYRYYADLDVPDADHILSDGVSESVPPW